MTFAKLKQYRTIVNQINIFEQELNIAYINGVDTSKPAVSSGKVSKPTEELAITLAYAKEYERLCKERDEIKKFIVHIKDEQVKEIAIRYFMLNQSFEVIGEQMNYDRRTISRKLNSYLKNAHNAR